MKKFKKYILFVILNLISINIFADSFSVDLGEGGSLSGRVIQLMAMLTVLSIAPSLLIMVTSFTRIVVVLSILRSALGLQQSPPTPVLMSLALFLTFFIMSPTMEQSYEQGVKPLIEEKVTEEKAFVLITEPFRQFMVKNTRDKDLHLFQEIAKIKEDNIELLPLKAVIPAFMISELRRAFEIGFLIFIPFLVIDILVSSILMALGMMMMPPVMVSLPFKIIFFVIIDGWQMLCMSLIKSFIT